MKTLIVFAKAPRKGSVKTRLLKNTPLNEEEVTRLYSSFLKDVLATAGRTAAEKIFINFTPKDAGDEMRTMAERAIEKERLLFAPQRGNDFAEKITNSFTDARKQGATSMVMIGSDSPTLKYKTVNRAFKKLARGAGAVLGPSGEGGLYLIGLKAGVTLDFHSIFSTGAELSNLARAAADSAVPVEMLGEVTDVDVAEDLVTLVSLIDAMEAAGASQPGFPENTAKTVKELGLKVERSSGTRSKVITR